MPEKLLIADDEQDILTLLKGFLESKGYFVLTAKSAGELLQKVKNGPDLILLDVGMPDMDGFEVCARIRLHVDCPIVFLTARVSEADKLKGFASGGDDYILKPFSPAELEARIKAHLRRENRRVQRAQLLFSGEMTVDYSRRCVFISDNQPELTKKEFDIVELLSQHTNQIFDKERIYEHVWGYDGQGDSGVVAEHIRRIRAKFAAFTDKNYIETVWGCGYRWIK